MKFTALKASKGTLSAHYIAFSLLAPICCLMGIGLAPSINWFHTSLLCVAALVTYTIAHCVHDLGHATSEYKTLSRKGLKILGITLAIISAGFMAYFAISVSLWVLAFAAVIPLVVLYRKGLVYTPFCFSGGLAVCVLLGHFIMSESLSLPAILMALFVLLLAHSGIMIYKLDEYSIERRGAVEINRISQETYGKVLQWIGLLAMSLIPLMAALLLMPR